MEVGAGGPVMVGGKHVQNGRGRKCVELSRGPYEENLRGMGMVGCGLIEVHRVEPMFICLLALGSSTRVLGLCTDYEED